ncbi:hypothetical protein, partial [uncultured Dialister sp.]|uniref:hypothetical protein n=1 Tax=uncultured Dialister sp. TaxID=278064 RepID=UPI0025D1986B
DANSELFKEAYDEVLNKNTYEIRFCELISASLEMHTYPRLRRYFPRWGKSALRGAFVLISISSHSAAKICPSGEDAAGGSRRGAFPTGKARLYGFPSERYKKHITQKSPALFFVSP